LLQAELLTTVKVVVGVEDSRNSLSSLLISYGALVFTRVELLEVEFAAGSLASPETQVVASASLVAGNYTNK
jgi:hypothetical protein